MAKPTKLELTWIGKENRPRLEPRILIEDPARSYHAPLRGGDKDLFDNRPIIGDNLLALKALEPEFAGTIKCVDIDPPFNTGQAFGRVIRALLPQGPVEHKIPRKTDGCAQEYRPTKTAQRRFR